MGSTQFVVHYGFFFDSLSATDSKGGVESPRWHMKDCMSAIANKWVPYKWLDILVELYCILLAEYTGWNALEAHFPCHSKPLANGTCASQEPFP